jgi:hypothetical protein
VYGYIPGIIIPAREVKTNVFLSPTVPGKLIQRAVIQGQLFKC